MIGSNEERSFKASARQGFKLKPVHLKFLQIRTKVMLACTLDSESGDYDKLDLFKQFKQSQ